jgi:GNAT superfamily N-acetyltransferase
LIVTVRIAVSADAESIARVQTRSWQVAYRGLLSDEYLDGLSWESRAEFWGRAVEAHAGNSVFVATDGTAVIGFAAAGPALDDDLPEFYQLYAIYLAPEVWGSGVGTDLLDAVLGVASGPGVALWVLDGNARARRFYERAGFAPDGVSRVEMLQGNRLDEVRYVRPNDWS